MKLVAEHEYRRHSLLNFERRDESHTSHWLIIAPDGITVLGQPKATEDDARAAVDAMLDAKTPTRPPPPSARLGAEVGAQKSSRAVNPLGGA
jgi:hypothetical protein